MNTIIDATQAKTQAPITDEMYNQFEAIAQRMNAKHPEINGKLLAKATDLAATVLIHSEPTSWERDASGRMELHGHRVATVNGYAIRTAMRGGTRWNSPKQYKATSCTCPSYRYESGTATIIKKVNHPHHASDPTHTQQTVCKHIAAYSIRKMYEQESKQRAAEFFTPKPAAANVEAIATVADSVMSETYPNGITHTMRTVQGITYHTESIERRFKYLHGNDKTRVLRRWETQATAVAVTA